MLAPHDAPYAAGVAAAGELLLPLPPPQFSVVSEINTVAIDNNNCLLAFI